MRILFNTFIYILFFFERLVMAREIIETKAIWGLEFDIANKNFGRFRLRDNDKYIYSSSLIGVVSELKLVQKENRENLIINLTDKDDGTVETIFFNFNDYNTYNVINALAGLHFETKSFHRFVIKIGAYPRRNSTTDKLEQGLSVMRPSTTEYGKWEIIKYGYVKEEIPQTKTSINPHTGEKTFDSSEKKQFWRNVVGSILTPALYPERAPIAMGSATQPSYEQSEQIKTESQISLVGDDIPF